ARPAHGFPSLTIRTLRSITWTGASVEVFQVLDARRCRPVSGVVDAPQAARDFLGGPPLRGLPPPLPTTLRAALRTLRPRRFPQVRAALRGGERGCLRGRALPGGGERWEVFAVDPSPPRDASRAEGAGG